jgi:hypothetical protein
VTFLKGVLSYSMPGILDRNQDSQTFPMVTVFSFISFFINLFVYNTNNSIFAVATCQQNNKTTSQHNYKAT